MREMGEKKEEKMTEEDDGIGCGPFCFLARFFFSFTFHLAS